MNFLFHDVNIKVCVLCVHVLSRACSFHVLIEARVIVFCDNAEIVLFSFAWVKPALGRFSAVTGVDRFPYYSDIFDVEELARDASLHNYNEL